MLSACLVNTVAFASGHPNHQEAEETTFISAPLQLDDSDGRYQHHMYYDLYSIDDASTHERGAWICKYYTVDNFHPPIYFREPEAKILQEKWPFAKTSQPADWVGESYIAIVYQAYASADPSDKRRVHNGIKLLPKTLKLTYQGKLGVNLDEWYPVNEPVRVGWAKHTANEVKALANLRLLMKPPAKG